MIYVKKGAKNGSCVNGGSDFADHYLNNNNMNLNNFTLKAQESVQKGFRYCQRSKGQQAVECAHILKGVMSEAESITNFLFGKMGINTLTLTKEIDTLIDSYPRVSGADSYVSSSVSEAFRKANDQAIRHER